MQDLTPVGLSKDGTRLVLLSDAGEEFAVVVDHRFRAALRGDPASTARFGQLEMKMESALRPRDIQARIRAGETAEEVAAAAQTTVDAIMGFAMPVLAERAHVASTALKASIRRRSADAAAARTLEQSSLTAFSDLGVRADDVQWDAWRREDGRWTVVAEYAAGKRAEFTYDQPGRYVVADNDDARLLTGEIPGAASDPTPARRLSSVPADDELPLGDGPELGDDAIRLVRPEPLEDTAPPSVDDALEDRAADRAGDSDTLPKEPVEDLLEHTADLRETVAGIHPPEAGDPVADHADADWIAPAAPHAPPVPADEPVDGAAPVPEPTAEEVAEREQKPRRKGRSSVPSWDEIMFGGGTSE